MTALRKRYKRMDLALYPDEYKHPDKRSRTWMFVFNNWNPEQLQAILEEDCIWVCCCEEVAPTTGTPHLQGYYLFKNPVNWSGLCQRHPGCWFKPANGSCEHNYRYVTKTRPERIDSTTKQLVPADVPNPPESFHEAGIRPSFTARIEAWAANSKKGGEATQELWDQAYEAAKLGDWDSIPKNILIANLSNLQRIYQLERAKVQPMENVNLRLWQQELSDILEGPVNPRAIYWYWEETGNVGKSFMASYIQRNLGGTVLSNGKTADIAHVLDQPKIVCFDLARDSVDHLNFSVMEDIKNGRIFSPKYQSICKAFDSPHLVVFANYPCPHGKFSADRLQEVNLANWTPTSAPPPSPITRPVLRRQAAERPLNFVPGFVLPSANVQPEEPEESLPPLDFDNLEPRSFFDPPLDHELLTHFDLDFLN